MPACPKRFRIGARGRVTTVGNTAASLRSSVAVLVVTWKRVGMYATIVECDMEAVTSSHDRGRLGRILASRLSSLPGFVAFIALDANADKGRVAGLCIFEDGSGMVAAENAFDEWQREYATSIGGGIQRLGSGAVIVQKGL